MGRSAIRSGMIRPGLGPSLLGIALVLAACEPGDDPAATAAAARQARLEKRWPKPAPAENANERIWQVGDGQLTLWAPDPTAPPSIPGEAVLYIHCAGGSLVVETDIVVSQDVPIPAPPFDTLTLEVGSERLATKLTPRSNGYTGWAAGAFPVSRTQAERLLAGPVLVIRPRYTGEPMVDSPEYDAGQQYAAPPAGLRDAFLKTCEAELA